jgi:hypothetical protein
VEELNFASCFKLFFFYCLPGQLPVQLHGYLHAKAWAGFGRLGPATGRS